MFRCSSVNRSVRKPPPQALQRKEIKVQVRIKRLFSSKARASETPLQSELNFTLILGYGAGNTLTAVGVDARTTRGEIRMVGDVEELRSELKLVLLRQIEIFHDGQIEVNQIGATKGPTARIAELPRNFLAWS